MNAEAMRAVILGRADRKPVAFEVPELGATVYLLPLSTGDRLRVAETFGGLGTAGQMSWLLVRSLCDAAGGLLFGDEDGGKLLDLAPETTKRLTDRILELNKLGVTAGEASAEKKDS